MECVNDFGALKDGHYESAVRILESPPKSVYLDFLPIDICKKLIETQNFSAHNDHPFKQLFIPSVEIECYGNFDEDNRDTPPPLFFAALGGSLEVVKYLVETVKCDPLQKSENGETVLHLACLGKNRLLVKYLIDWCHCDVDVPSFRYFLNYLRLKQEFLIMNYACHGGNNDIIRFLFLNFESVRDSCNLVEIAHLTCSKGYCESLELILSSFPGYDNFFDNDYGSLAHTACKNDQVGILKYFQNHSEFRLNAVNYNGYTPIQLACASMSFKVIQFWIFEDQNFSVLDCTSSADIRTPTFVDVGLKLLRDACYFDVIEVIEFLLSAMKSIDKLNHQKSIEKCMILAADQNSIRIIEYFLLQQLIPMTASAVSLTLRKVVYLACMNGSLQLLDYIAPLINFDEVISDDGETPFLVACKFGNFNIVNYLLTSHAHLDFLARDYSNNTALHLACSSSDLKIVNTLVDIGIFDFFATNSYESTPLHVAFSSKNWEVVNYLLTKEKRYLTAKFDHGESFLHLCCKNDAQKIVQQLTESMSEVDFTVTDNHNNTLIHSAALAQSNRVLNFLLESHDIKRMINAKNDQQESALHICCRNGGLEPLKTIVSCGYADITARDCSFNTPIHEACRKNNSDIVDYLLTCCETNIFARNKNGETPLSFACIHQNDKSLYSLLLYGQVDLMKQIPCYPYRNLLEFLCITKYFEAPWYRGAGVVALCRQHGQFNLIEHHVAQTRVCTCISNDERTVSYYLVEHNARPISSVNVKGETLLHVACKEKNLTLAKILVSAGCINPMTTDKHGNTALFWACPNTHFVNYLLSRKEIDLNSPNYEGNTILHIACFNGYLEIVQMILKIENIQLLAENLCGNTAFHLACADGNMQIVECLYKKSPGLIDVINPLSLETPLHVALNHGHLKVAMFIIKCRERVENDQSTDCCIGYGNIINKKGESSLTVACKCEYWSIIELLVKSRQVMLTDKVSGNQLLLHFLCQNKQITMLKQQNVRSKDLLAKDDYGDTPLHLACKIGSLELVKYFLEIGVRTSNLTDHNVSGQTPLSITCNNCNFEILKSLLSHHSVSPMTPLAVNNDEFLIHFICETRSMDLTEYLDFDSVSGFDLSTVDCNNETALDIAVRQDHPGLVRLLFFKGEFDPAISDWKKNNVLHFACRHNMIDLVTYIMEKSTRLLSYRNNCGETPLAIACDQRCWAVIKLLLSLSAVQLSSTISDESLLIHFLCYQNRVDILNECYKPGMTIMVKDADGNTPLHVACKTGSLATVNYLLSVGVTDNHILADLNLLGETPLSISYCNHHFEILRSMLLQVNHKVNPMVKLSQKNEFLLHFICRELSFTEIINYLDFENKVGLSFCTPDINGDTPLDIAIRHSNLEMVQQLFKTGQFDPTMRDKDGNNLLHFACIHNMIDLVIQIVGKNKEIIRFRNQAGETPLNYACTNFHWNIIYYLLSLGEVKLLDVLNEGENHTFFHFLCSNGKIEILEKYEITNSCLLIQNSSGNTPLHSACMNERLKIVRHILFNNDNIDFTIKNDLGETALSIACSHQNWDIVQCFILSGRIDAMTPITLNGDEYLLHFICEHKQNWLLEIFPMEKIETINMCNAKGETILYVACKVGNLRAVQLLLNLEQIDVMAQCPVNGDTPLHVACKGDNTEIVDLLLSSEKKCAFAVNAAGSTPLHVACQFQNLNFVECFLSHGCIDILVRDMYNRTVIDLAKQSYELMACFHPFVQSHQEFPVEKYCKVFLCGHSTNGKTSLALSIKQRLKGAISQSWLDKVNPFKASEKAEPLTAGIVSHQIESENIGNIILYDLAGHPEYYSSHHAVLENLLLKSPAIFIIIVKLTDEIEEISRQLYYWSSLTQYASARSSKICPIIIVGSHADKLNTPFRLKHFVSSRLNTFKFDDIITLNCKNPTGPDFKKLTDSLCKDIEIILKQCDNISFSCHVLYAFLMKLSEPILFCKLKQLVKEENSRMCQAILPENDTNLVESLLTLSDRGLILFNHNSGDASWIIVDKASILNTVNGTMFAPNSFKEHQSCLASNTGLVPLAKLKEIFPQYDLSMIVEFMMCFEFCRRVDEVTAKCICPSTDDYENMLFFPALVGKDTHSKEAAITDGFGWCLWCSEKYNFFSNRLLDVLLLRLAYMFSSTSSQHGCIKNSSNENVKSLDRFCSIWKNGISWNKSGVKVTVQIAEYNRRIVLLIEPLIKQSHLSCMEIYSSIVDVILKVKDEFCSYCETEEYLISPTDLKNVLVTNLANLSVFAISDIARCVLKKQMAVTSSKNEAQDLDVLLGQFEPYHLLPLQMIVGLLQQGDNAARLIPESTMQEIRARCPAIMDCFLKPCSTYLTMRQHLNKFSLFINRNLFDIANFSNEEMKTFHCLTSEENLSLQTYSSKILDLIDPVEFSNYLYSEDLLSHEAKDDILSTSVLSRREKGQRLLSCFEETLSTAEDKVSCLLRFCEMLAKIDNPGLKRISQEIKTSFVTVQPTAE